MQWRAILVAGILCYAAQTSAEDKVIIPVSKRLLSKIEKLQLEQKIFEQQKTLLNIQLALVQQEHQRRLVEKEKLIQKAAQQAGVRLDTHELDIQAGGFKTK